MGNLNKWKESWLVGWTNASNYRSKKPLEDYDECCATATNRLRTRILVTTRRQRSTWDCAWFVGRWPEEAAKVLFNSGAQKLKRQQQFYAYIYLNNIVDALVDLSKVRERIQLRKGQVSKIGHVLVLQWWMIIFSLSGSSVPTPPDSLLCPLFIHAWNQPKKNLLTVTLVNQDGWIDYCKTYDSY